VTGGPHGSGPVAAAPLIRRGAELRSELILRVFAVERFLRFLVLGVAAYGVWRFSYDRAGIQQAYNNDLPACTGRDLGFNVSHSKLLGLIHDAFMFSPRWLTLLAAWLAVYALIEKLPKDSQIAARWRSRELPSSGHRICPTRSDLPLRFHGGVPSRACLVRADTSIALVGL
jgi:hypothetical protein